MSGLKALTVKNPWAALIVSGKKDIENRSWRTNYRGMILIHCSMQGAKLNQKTLGDLANYGSYPRDKAEAHIPHWNKAGEVIGSVEIIDCVRNHESVWAEEDCWHWVLANPRYFLVGLKAKGKLGIWNYDKTTTSI